jgi:predicted component of type VI protein secretion system
LNRKLVLMLLVLCLMITGGSSIFAVKSLLPVNNEISKWAVELHKSKLPSPQPEKFKSYELLATNLSEDTIDVTFELYRPVQDPNQEQIILTDPFSYVMRPNETVSFSQFFIKNGAKEMEVVLTWSDQNRRKHKQSIRFTDIE